MSNAVDADPYYIAAELIYNAKYGICLTGAGISTESGIPDFRSPTTGLWAKYEPEIYANLENFLRDPRLFWEMAKKIAPALFRDQTKPMHKILSKLELLGHLKAIITQNVDGLHQAAGSSLVYELHGNVFEYQCVGCRGSYSFKRMQQKVKSERESGPMCDVCGMPLKPNVVLFGEDLPRGIWLESVALSEKCDLFLSMRILAECCPRMFIARDGA